MSRVLLLGAGGNAGINFTKCLKDHVVYGADMNKYYLPTCNAKVKVKVDYSSEEKKVESIKKIVDWYKIDAIHAQPDPEVEFLLKHFQGEKVFNHSLDSWDKFRDKYFCQKIWSEEIREFKVYSYKMVYEYPILFGELLERGGGKVWIRAIKGAGSKAALPITTMYQGENWVNYWRDGKGLQETDFMLSQFLPGREFAVQTFWINGQLVQSQARERLVYFFGALMPSGQTSTPAVARISSDRLVYETAYKAIKAIDKVPHGIYCVDLKEDVEGFPMPMEVNYGRFFTTSDFFAEVGVNTPEAYINSIVGLPVLKKVESVTSEKLYWIRGLDKVPQLINEEDLC